MRDFPPFMKSPLNRIPVAAQSTPGIEGYVYEGADGTQMAFWMYSQTAASKEHVHEFDEYMDVVDGCYTMLLDGRRLELNPGQEYFIPSGVAHGGEVVAGTRTIHAFGGTRIPRR